MTVATLLRDLSALGVELRSEGGMLHVGAPVGVVTPELRHELPRHKPTVLRALRWLQTS